MKSDERCLMFCVLWYLMYLMYLMYFGVWFGVGGDSSVWPLFPDISLVERVEDTWKEANLFQLQVQPFIHFIFSG
jgi:hypothetical protein